MPESFDPSKRRVKCSLVFYYDPETYLNEFAVVQVPSDEEIFRQCALLMLEDINNNLDPLMPEAVHCEFVENEDASV